jgi:HEAT repeat protein
MSFFSGLFGPPDVDKLKADGDVSGLIKVLGNWKNGNLLRRDAAEALGEIGNARAVKPLGSALYDTNEGIRMAAADALRKMGAPAVESLISNVNCFDKNVCTTSADILGKIGTPAVEPLIDLMGDGSENHCRAAADILRKIGTPAVEPLIAALARWNKVWGTEVQRGTAINVLGDIGNAHAVEPLIVAINDENTYVNMAATEALGKIGTPAVEPLIALLGNKSTDVRKAAAKTLGKIGDARAVEPLRAALYDENCLMGRAAADALDEIGWEPDLGIECVGIESARYWIVKTDRRKCVAIGTPAVEPLIAAINEWDDAIDVLGDIGDARAVESLIVILRDREGYLRKAAAEALKTIYYSGRLDQLVKNQILGMQHVMAQRHTDKGAPSDCSHNDEGIGITL